MKQLNNRILLIILAAFFSLSSCHLSSDRQSKIHDGTIVDKENVKVASFKRNCITCHAIMNSNKSYGGITLNKIETLGSDSMRYYYHKAITNVQHKEIDVKVFDTLMDNSKNEKATQ